MITNKTIKLKRPIELLFTSGVVLIMVITTYASQGLVQDRRVTWAQAEAMAKNAQIGSEFPIVVNDLVVKQLNRYLGTTEGREFIRQSLIHMGTYKTIVNEKIQEYRVPVEIMAIPIVESGYQNLKNEDHSERSVGVWQVIQRTAELFGLNTKSQHDERLNVDLESDAAIRLLLSDKLRFQDWLLSIMAYNMGHDAVQAGITKFKTRDPWELTRHGVEGDKDYLSKVMAAIIILKNPNSVSSH